MYLALNLVKPPLSSLKKKKKKQSHRCRATLTFLNNRSIITKPKMGEEERKSCHTLFELIRSQSKTSWNQTSYSYYNYPYPILNVSLWNIQPILAMFLNNSNTISILLRARNWLNKKINQNIIKSGLLDDFRYAWPKLHMQTP